MTAQRGGAHAPMSYFELLSRFWQLEARQAFTPTQTKLYFYWLHRFNAERWPAQLYRRQNQVCADLNLDEDTVSKARAVLEKRGLLRFKAGTKAVAASWTLDYGVPKNAPTIAPNNSESSPEIAPNNSGQSGSNEENSCRIAPKNSDPIRSRPDSFNDKDHTPKKGGAGEAEFSSTESKKITAPNPVAARPSPATVCLEPGNDESRTLAAEMAELWHISAGKNPRRWGQFATFTRTLAAAGRLEEVRTQFDAYRRHRQLKGIGPHSVDNYLGHELHGYTDGAWCDCDWVATAADAKPKPTHGTPEAPARAGGAPSQRKKDW